MTHLNILMFFWVSEVKEKIDSIRTKYILVCWCHFYTAKISGFDINCFDKWEIEYYVSGYGNSCFYLWEKYEGLLGLSLHIHFHTWLKHYTVSVGLEGPKSFNVSQSSFAYSSGYKSISTTLQHYISIQIPVTFTGSCWHSLFVSHLCNLNILLPLPRMRELSFQFQSPIHCSVILLFHAVIPWSPINTLVFFTESSISLNLSLPSLLSFFVWQKSKETVFKSSSFTLRV